MRPETEITEEAMGILWRNMARKEGHFRRLPMAHVDRSVGPRKRILRPDGNKAVSGDTVARVKYALEINTTMTVTELVDFTRKNDSSVRRALDQLYRDGLLAYSVMRNNQKLYWMKGEE